MSLVNFKARNHPQQVAANGAREDTDDRRTPHAIWEALNARHQFTLDVAATAENTKCARFCRDGLVESWVGERVWCNPPYSDCGAWVSKAWTEMRAGCKRVVMLLPANRTEQAWWQEFVEPWRDQVPDSDVPPAFHLTVRFLAGRQRFERPGWIKPVKGDRPPFGLCLLTWYAR